MKDFSATDTLLTALPVLLVLLALIGAIIFFPQGSTFDIRGKAAPIQSSPATIPLPTITPPNVEITCSTLYQPVCSKITQKTYANPCEAGLADALPVIAGKCSLPPMPVRRQ